MGLSPINLDSSKINMQYFERLKLVNCYDDGKIRESRQYKVIPIRILDYDELWPLAKQHIEIAIEEDKDDKGNTHLYKAENPQVLEAVSYEYENNPQLIYFIETKDGGWFGAGKYDPQAHDLNVWDACGRLDLDNKLTEQLENDTIGAFLYSRIGQISHTIPNIKVKYAYDKTTDFHVVTLVSNDDARSSQQYIEWKYKLWKDFNELFPGQDLSIEEQ